MYGPGAMPAASVARARALYAPAVAAQRCGFCALPLDDGQRDAHFVFFSAHELRAAGDREAFFAELRRTLRPGGVLVVAEFMRNGWSVLAFGPGAFHALPRREWLRLGEQAGFALREELSMTPFVRVFVWERRTP